MTTTCEPDLRPGTVEHPTGGTADVGPGQHPATVGRIAPPHYSVVALGVLIWVAGVLASVRLLVIALADPAPGTMVRFAVAAAATAGWAHCLRSGTKD